MSDHTPGPWQLDITGRVVLKKRGSTVRDFEVASVADHVPPAVGGDYRANARLITLSPELRDALEECEGALHAVSEAAGPTPEVVSVARDTARELLERIEDY